MTRNIYTVYQNIFQYWATKIIFYFTRLYVTFIMLIYLYYRFISFHSFVGCPCKVRNYRRLPKRNVASSKNIFFQFDQSHSAQQKTSQQQTVDDLRQAIRCFHKRQHAHLCKRMWSEPQGHLKITTSAGSGKKWQVCCTPNGDSAPHGLAEHLFVLTDAYCTKWCCPSKTYFFIGCSSKDQLQKIRCGYDICILFKSRSIHYMTISPWD